MTISIGAMNKQVAIQAPTEVDGALGPTVTWATSATVWMQKWSLRGDERMDQSQPEARVTHRFRCRYTSLLDDEIGGPSAASFRLMLGSCTYDIKFVNKVDGRRIEMVIDALEIAGVEATR